MISCAITYAGAALAPKINYIFGEKSETVIEHYEKADYVSKDYYEKSPVIKAAVDFIISKEAFRFTCVTLVYLRLLYHNECLIDSRIGKFQHPYFNFQISLLYSSIVRGFVASMDMVQ